jgi:alkaline phosphatase D
LPAGRYPGGYLDATASEARHPRPLRRLAASRAFTRILPVCAASPEATIPRGRAGCPRAHRAERLRWGRLLEIFVLDTRGHRSANWKRDGPDKTMLGADQRRWLMEGVAASTATWKVVVSSVPLSIAKGWPFGDSWARRNVLGWKTGFAAERDAILAEVRRRGVRSVIALVADVHFGALMTHRLPDGPEVHELIAGPLAARPKTPDPPDDDLQSIVHAQRGGEPTFGELQVAANGFTARLLDAAGAVLGEFSWPAPATEGG